MLPKDITTEMLEEAFKNHKRKTCKVDCCIICFSESIKNGSMREMDKEPTRNGWKGWDPFTSANIMKYAKDYEAGY
jgi:hypothetical protein